VNKFGNCPPVRQTCRKGLTGDVDMSNEKELVLIYTYLGNGIQHDLCLRFVASGYDLEIIREEERKQ
jgi:hypothetical protein